MVTLSQTGEYALRAAVHIAAAGGVPVRVGPMAETLDLPRNYLSKTLHQLVRAGVLKSTRGPHGGFALAIPPAELTLAALLEPLGAFSDTTCLMGRKQCRDNAPCAAHWRWKSVSQQLQAFFTTTTVADLVQGQDLPRSLPIQARKP